MLPHGHILHVTCTYTHVHVYIVSHRNKSLYELVHVTYSVYIYNSRGDTIFTVNNTVNVLHFFLLGNYLNALMMQLVSLCNI